MRRKCGGLKESNERWKNLFRDLMKEAMSKSKEVNEVRKMLKNLLRHEERSL